MGGPRAAIDLGSNSVLLTVLSERGEVLHDEARVVGLGKGLGDGGAFDAERMEVAIEALGAYAARAEELGVPAGEIVAIATSASRRASNSGEFYERVERECGVRFEIISGAREAELTFRGAVEGFAGEGQAVAVIDLGGGSTEVVQGIGLEMGRGISLELGSTRLTERFLGEGAYRQEDLAALRAHVRTLCEQISPSGASDTLAISVAGTATTLAGAALGHDRWIPEEIHGATLTRNQLSTLAQRLMELPPERRLELAPFAPKRINALLAGASVIELVLERLGLEQTTVSVRGLRFGALSEG